MLILSYSGGLIDYAIIVSMKSVLSVVGLFMIIGVVYAQYMSLKQRKKRNMINKRLVPGDFPTHDVNHAMLWAIQDMLERYGYVRSNNTLNQGYYKKGSVTVIFDITDYPYKISIDVSGLTMNHGRLQISQLENKLKLIQHEHYTQ